MRSVSDFIEVLGGSTTVASLLGLPGTTVASWKGRKSIPVEHWPKLLEIARDRGIEGGDYEMLVGLHARPVQGAQ
jgi:hypothetical protein